MARIFTDAEASLEPLKGKVVAILGYGSQGRAWALNLRDSGVEVVVGLRPEGASWARAKAEGFEVVAVGDAVEVGDVVAMLVPDMAQPKLFEEQVRPKLSDGKGLCFAHGFNVHYGLVKPPEFVDVFMVAPKAPGAKVREEFVAGRGVPALVAVHQDRTGRALERALAVAKGIGCTRAGAILTTFKEETETDLIGEQCVLVGGLMELIKKGFEVLVEMGYQPEVAYFEVCNEAKLIMDLIHAGGLSGMLRGVSETARYGGLTVGPQVIDEKVKDAMRKAARRVVDGTFAKEWVEEHAKGAPTLKKLLEEVERHPIEAVGREMRRLMGLQG